MINDCKFLIRKLYKIYKILINTILFYFFDPNPIVAYWWTGGADGKNWGDALNPVLIQKLSNRNVYLVSELICLKSAKVFSVVGSVLGNYSEKNLVVWGSGLISSNRKLQNKQLKVHAVRGPLTRKFLLQQNIECPEIYGDPALLYPLFYNPKIEKKYRIGIISHFTDVEHPFLNKLNNERDILIIDVKSDIDSFINKILSCQAIASSSLHGIIAADAYNVPSKWIVLYDNIGGDNLKFYDYFLSVDRRNEEPFIVKDSTDVDVLLRSFSKYRCKIDLVSLLESCPFLDEDVHKLLKFKLLNHHMSIL